MLRRLLRRRPPPLLASAIVTVTFLFFSCALAKPVGYFPINSQLPPVARVSEPFSFVFSPLTFSSEPGIPDAGEISYSLSAGAPAWLRIDSDARRLFGTPDDGDFPSRSNGGDQIGNEDVVGVQVELVARDATGEANANITLVVSRNRGPEVGIPLEDQIADMGPHSAPSLLLYPSRQFSFTFAKRTFRVPGNEEGSAMSPLNYYAVSADNAPLPSWISFDATTLTFSGTTPPFGSLVQPPQTFGFQLVASDVVGFASAAMPFSIVIGNHELTADKTFVRLNATRGDPFVYAGLRGMLKIDGKRPEDVREEEDTTVMAMDVPKWLDFDEEAWVLAGTPDADSKSANITITVADRYADTLNVTLMIELEDPDLFVSDLPDVNVTAGTDLSFDLKRYLFNPAKVDVSVTSRPKAPWLYLDPISKKLSGTAPKLDAKGYASEITVVFKATPKKRSRSDSGTSRDTRTMHLRLTDPIAPTAPTSTPIPPPTPSPKPEEPADNDKSQRKLLWLLLPFLLLVCISIIFLVLWLRRRRHRAESVKSMEVSAPIPGTFVNHNAWPGASDIRGMVDIGPDGEQSQQKFGGDLSPHPQHPRNVSDPPSSLPPHALSIYTDRRKSRSESALLIAATKADPPRGSWLTRWPQPSFQRAGATSDGRSLLSDTSLGSGDDIHQHGMEGLPSLARAKTRAPTTKENVSINKPDGRGSHPYQAENRPLQLLELPLISDEPFSIQPTPEMAYQPPGEGAEGGGRGKYDFISSSSGGSSPREGETHSDFLSTTSSEQVTPVIGYTRRASGRQSSSHNKNSHSGRPRSSGLGLGVRLSKVLKRSPSTTGSPGSRGPRDSRLSSSTEQTTRTSILTTAIAEQAQIRARAGNTASVVARPTIVHIPSRPGESRQTSRMVSGGLQSPSGNQIDDRYSNIDTNNNNNNDTNTNTNTISNSRDPGEEPLHRGALSPPPRIYVVEAAHRDSDSSWDRLARDSLGIAHKDLGADIAAPARAPVHTHVQKQGHQGYDGGFATAAARPRRLFSTSPDMYEEDGPNWKSHHRQDLMAPDQWPGARAPHPPTTTAPAADYPTPALTYQTGTTPSPATGSIGGDNEDGDGMATPVGMFGLGTDMDALVGARSSWTKPLRISEPETPSSRDRGGAGGAGETNDTSETTTASNSIYQTPASRPPTHRRQAPISQTTPSPPPPVPLPLPQLPADAQAAVSARPLPETPTPAGRGIRSPLTDRLNESTPTPQTPVRPARSIRSVRSVRRRKSSRGYDGEAGAADDNNDHEDDLWEDIRPPESTFGGDWEDQGRDSDGSFAVYI